MIGDEIVISGKKLISLRRASQLSGYHRDYIGQLCRGKKITAEQIGRDWFCDPDELLSYKSNAKEKKIENGKSQTAKKHSSGALSPRRYIPAIPTPSTLFFKKAGALVLSLFVVAGLMLGWFPLDKVQAAYHKWGTTVTGAVRSVTDKISLDGAIAISVRAWDAADEKAVALAENIARIGDALVYAGIIVKDRTQPAITDEFLQYGSNFVEASSIVFSEVKDWPTIYTADVEEFGGSYSRALLVVGDTVSDTAIAASEYTYDIGENIAKWPDRYVASVGALQNYSTRAFGPLFAFGNKVYSLSESIADSTKSLGSQIGVTARRMASITGSSAAELVSETKTAILDGGGRQIASAVASPGRFTRVKSFFKNSFDRVIGRGAPEIVNTDKAPLTITDKSKDITTRTIENLRKELERLKESGVVVDGPISERLIVERVVQRDIGGVSQGGVSQDRLELELNALNNRLMQEIVRVADSGARSRGSNFRAIAHTQRIDSLQGTTLTDITVNGVTGLTDADIPDDITINSSGNVGSGTAGQTPYYATASDTLTATSTVFIDTNSRVGIGTTTPGAKFSVTGNGLFSGVLDVTSTTATSTFANGIKITDGCYLLSDGTCAGAGISIGAALTGSTAGSVLFVDSSGNLAQDNASLYFDDTNNRLGLGSTTPNSLLTVDGLFDVPQLTVFGTTTQTSNVVEFRSKATNNPSFTWSNTGIATFDSFVNGDVFVVSKNGSNLFDVTDSGIISISGKTFRIGSGNLRVQIGGSKAGVDALSLGLGTSYVTPVSNGITAASNQDIYLYPQGTGTLTIGDSSTSETTSLIELGLTTVVRASTNFGISSSTPYARFSVNADSGSTTPLVVVASSTDTYFEISSTGTTTITNLVTGAASFDTDAGAVTWVDLPVTSSAAAGVIERYTAKIDSNSLLTVYSESDGAGGIQNEGVGIGTTTPYGYFAVHSSSTKSALTVRQVNSGNNGPLALFYNGGAEVARLTSAGSLGIGTTTPSGQFAITGSAYLDSREIVFSSSTASTLTVKYETEATSTIKDSKHYAFSIATSTTATPVFFIDTLSSGGSGQATSTFNGGFVVDGGAIEYDYGGGVTRIDNLELGALNFDSDAGIIAWSDLPVTSSAANNAVESYSAQLDGNAVLTIFGKATGGGAIHADYGVGIASSTPWARFSVELSPSSTPAFIVADTGTSTPFLLVDSHGRVGIGDGAATSTLSVAGGDVHFEGAGNDEGFFFDQSSIRVGIGTTTPWAKFSVSAESGDAERLVVVASSTDTYFEITSTGTTTISNLVTGSLGFDTNAGIVTAFDLPVTSAAPAGTVEGYIFQNDASTTLTIYSESDGSGGVTNQRVGIATSSPSEALEVLGNVLVQGGLCLRASGVCPAFADGRLYVDTAGTASADDPGDIFDLAERYPSSEEITSGEIISIDPASDKKATVRKAREGDTVIGIMSTQSAIAINGSNVVLGPAREATSTKPLVALTGRVPVKVNLENGPIGIGDRIMLSSVSGVGKKSDGSGQTVGIALEPFNAGDEDGKILVFVNLNFVPGVSGTSIGDVEDGFTAGEIDANNLVLTTILDLLKSVGVTVESALVRVKNVVADKVTANKIEANKIVIEKGIEIKDSATGDVYCVRITSGEWSKFKGTCGEVPSSAFGGEIPSTNPPAGGQNPNEVQSSNIENQNTSEEPVATTTPPIESVATTTPPVATTTSSVIEPKPMATTTPEVIQSTSDVNSVDSGTATSTPPVVEEEPAHEPEVEPEVEPEPVATTTAATSTPVE